MSRILQVVIGFVFLASGALKMLQPVQTVLGVGAYDLLPPGMALIAGLVLPGLEVAVGAALLTGFVRQGATLIAVCLSLVFLLFVGSAWLRGFDATCGCFGPLDLTAQTGWQSTLFDLLLFAGCLVVWRRGAARREGGIV
jgi:uncharacterized membrane protein YphA (DoxX/SURF4 family)